jgi:hypothetical protein
VSARKGPAPLGVVSCHFNPCGYRSRLANYTRFQDALKQAPVHLLTVELAFGDAPFEIEPDETELMRVRGWSVMWQKERLLNLGLRKLVDDGFDRLCYLDADILFDDANWAARILSELEHHRFVQVFDTVHRFGREARGAVSLLHDPSPRLTVRRQGIGWAVRREVLQRATLYENLVVGGGDTLMFWALLRHPVWESFHAEVERHFMALQKRAGPALSEDIDRWSADWTEAVGGDIGFARNRIVGLPHGPREARGYGRRLRILKDAGFDPALHLDASGSALEWNDPPDGLRHAVERYFQARDEDAPEDAPVEA